ncbi:hypothetical protein Dimus_000575 [Dionaea muscipula]
MHIDAVKEFYVSLTLVHYKKKEFPRSRVRGVEIEFDSLKLASILSVPGNNSICEYIKEVCKKSKISRNEALPENVVPRFGKRDTTSYMDLIYMDHLTSRRLVNLPRVMMRHMSYVISVKDHELSYGDWLTMVFKAFNVPLIDKQGKEPKRYDYFEETFLTMCQLKRDNGVWWLGTETVVDEAALQGESRSDDQFYDVQVKVEEPIAEALAIPVFSTSPGDSTNVLREPATAVVDSSIPSGSIPDSMVLKLQADLEQAQARRLQADLEKAQAENAQLLTFLQQAQS